MEIWETETMGSVSITASYSRSGDHVYSTHTERGGGDGLKRWSPTYGEVCCEA
jgi:hypothetical protein